LIAIALWTPSHPAEISAWKAWPYEILHLDYPPLLSPDEPPISGRQTSPSVVLEDQTAEAE
jgi:hypothetical protein